MQDSDRDRSTADGTRSKAELGRFAHDLRHLVTHLHLLVSDLGRASQHGVQAQAVTDRARQMDEVFDHIDCILTTALAASREADLSEPRPIVRDGSAESRPLEVLWVDDDIFHSELFSNRLRDFGWSVTTAPTACDALSMVQQKRFDGLVTDLLMPAGECFSPERTRYGMRTGLVLAEEVRKMFPAMPVAFVTVAADEWLREWCAAHAPSDCFSKGGLPSEQVKSLDSLMRHGTSSTAALQEWLGKFGLLASALSSRFDGRSGITLDDEYDVQDVLHALLLMKYGDVRREEWTPSYAGGSSRIDFVIPSIHTAVEVKMTRRRAGAKQIGEELLVDVSRYRTHPSVGSLVCFIVDATAAIKSPSAFVSDLSKASTPSLQVSTVIWPLSGRPNRDLQPSAARKKRPGRRG